MRKRLFFATLALTGAALASAQDHSLTNESLVGVGNTSISGYIGELADDRTDGSDGRTSSAASTTATFGGMKRDGTDGGTIGYAASSRTSTQYGTLHAFAQTTVTNSFYNADNPIYYDSRDNSFHPGGTPDFLCSLCFADFNDTLQYGGVALQGGYEARFVFHIDGTNTGDIGDYGLSAASAGLSVNVDSASDGQGFYDAVVNQDFGTKGFAVNGQTAQRLNVQFSAQVVFNAYQYDDGTDLTGTSDFSETASLAGIALYDPRTNTFVPTSQWSVTSASGTHYTQLNSAPVPEPTSFLALGGVVLVALRKKRKSEFAERIAAESH